MQTAGNAGYAEKSVGVASPLCVLAPDPGASPGEAGMASAAVRAESAIVRVVPGMAPAAIGRQLHLVRRFYVTALALEFRVRALQREVRGAAMIKLPELPAIRVVAARALLAEMAMMYIVGLVASHAVARGASKRLTDVALLARHARVQADERESRHVVIEPDLILPA